jgi:hypothetical protein
MTYRAIDERGGVEAELGDGRIIALSRGVNVRPVAHVRFSTFFVPAMISSAQGCRTESTLAPIGCGFMLQTLGSDYASKPLILLSQNVA